MTIFNDYKLPIIQIDCIFSFKVAYSSLYNVSSASDKCTMYSDRNLVNRRNVKGDVTAAANACRRFFQLEVESRVIAGTLHVLGMSNIDDKQPTAKMSLPCSDDDVKSKRDYLYGLASLVVNTFVIDGERNREMEQSTLDLEKDDDEQPDITGRYHCRFPGCPKTFKHQGKLRRDHEASHTPPLVIRNADTHIIKSKSRQDDMLSYQMALLDYGMLIINFWDGISEGDGERVIRCWKFFLLYLKHHGASSKYALEALYLMFQINTLLSPRSSHRLMWNRFVKNKQGPGGNIPLDLQLEFYNKLVKEAIKKLGPNASKKSLDRICHSLGITSILMKNFDSNLSVRSRAGKHVKKSAAGDLQKIVNELLVNKAFTHTPGRAYKFYSSIKPSIIDGFDMQKMYLWINNHKKHLILNRKAR